MQEMSGKMSKICKKSANFWKQHSVGTVRASCVFCEYYLLVVNLKQEPLEDNGPHSIIRTCIVGICLPKQSNLTSFKRLSVSSDR